MSELGQQRRFDDVLAPNTRRKSGRFATAGLGQEPTSCRAKGFVRLSCCARGAPFMRDAHCSTGLRSVTAMSAR